MDNKKNELDEFVTQSIYFGEITQKSEAMDSQVWDRYLNEGSRKLVKRGDYILRIEDNAQGLFFIKKGRVKGNLLTKDGSVKTIYIKEEKTIFGEQFIFHRQPGIIEVIALEDCELYFFSKDKMLELIKKDFDLTLFICRSQAIIARIMAYQIQDLSKNSTLQSLARILYSIFCYESSKNKKSQPITINITHEELANMLGVHRVTVTKNINYLKKLGFIDDKYEKLIILKPEDLKELSK